MTTIKRVKGRKAGVWKKEKMMRRLIDRRRVGLHDSKGRSRIEQKVG